jgi:hypothetical protein
VGRIGMGEKARSLYVTMIPDRTGPSASRGERPRRRGLRNGDPQASNDDDNDTEDVLFARRRLQDVVCLCRDDGFASSWSSPSAAVASPGGGRGSRNFSTPPASSCFASRYVLPSPVLALARATKRRGRVGPCGRCPLPLRASGARVVLVRRRRSSPFSSSDPPSFLQPARRRGRCSGDPPCRIRRDDAAAQRMVGSGPCWRRRGPDPEQENGTAAAPAASFEGRGASKPGESTERALLRWSSGPSAMWGRRSASSAAVSSELPTFRSSRSSGQQERRAASSARTGPGCLGAQLQARKGGLGCGSLGKR